MRSASVDLPWSMCAMIEKLRMRDWSIAAHSVPAARPWAAVAGGSRRDARPRGCAGGATRRGRRRHPRRAPRADADGLRHERLGRARRRAPSRSPRRPRRAAADATATSASDASVSRSSRSPTRSRSRRHEHDDGRRGWRSTSPAGCPTPRRCRRAPSSSAVLSTRLPSGDPGRQPDPLQREEGAVEQQQHAVGGEAEREGRQRLGGARRCRCAVQAPCS